METNESRRDRHAFIRSHTAAEGTVYMEGGQLAAAGGAPRARLQAAQAVGCSCQQGAAAPGSNCSCGGCSGRRLAAAGGAPRARLRGRASEGLRCHGSRRGRFAGPTNGWAASGGRWGSKRAAPGRSSFRWKSCLRPRGRCRGCPPRGTTHSGGQRGAPACMCVLCVCEGE